MVEVLSPSTKHVDTGKKLEGYFRVPSIVHYLVVDPERRMVTTERMTGAPFPANVNDLQFDEADGVTLLTLLVTYPDRTQRDAVLATGMTDGMEASYQRLEREVLAAMV